LFNTWERIPDQVFKLKSYARIADLILLIEPSLPSNSIDSNKGGDM
jgi:hypothetical protein